jgi:hypothetical protein
MLTAMATPPLTVITGNEELLVERALKQLIAEVSGDWSYRLRESKGTLLAFAVFVAMFTIYASNHPAGFSANVATTAANKGVLLAIVAMAQTLVVE